MANKAEIPAKFCRDFDVICPMFSPINIALFFSIYYLTSIYSFSYIIT